MFDPRMMAPDGSSYSRNNVLAVPQLAATSGMTPPGVQTITGPAPIPVNGPGGRGANGGPGRQPRSVLDNFNLQDKPWYQQWVANHPNFTMPTRPEGGWADGGGYQQRLDARDALGAQLADWRGLQPAMAPGQPMPWAQMQEWWSSRPQRQSVFQGF